MNQHKTASDGLPEKGTRIELIHTSDPYTNLCPGSLGTVTGGHDGIYAQVWVQWDSGSTIGLIPGEDAWREVQA